jgi:two-component system, OmpR family, sensor histidine kinase KdpD
MERSGAHAARPGAEGHSEARSRRGKLTLYVGFAPGVGKTSRLLDDAHALRRRGVDVVGALVETRGRTETAARVAGLELVPRRAFEYRGVVVEELDLEAVLRRAPAAAVVDDVPHTNVPGSTNRRRYQDVLQLLAAGIDVIGALDVQHLESLNDVVARSTGVVVRETVPDSFLEQAQQVVCLDLSAEDLVERLERGDLRAPDAIPSAREHLFRDATLATLRELALREVAESLERSATRRAPPDPLPQRASGRVMVCLSSNPPHSLALLRRGSRMAGRLNTSWYVVYVETPREAPERIRPGPLEQLAVNVEKARELGAEVVRLRSGDPAAALLQFARSHRVRDVILGRTKQPWWRRFARPTVFDRLVRDGDGLDLHVVSLLDEERHA